MKIGIRPGVRGFYAQIPAHEEIGPFSTKQLAMSTALVVAATILAHEISDSDRMPARGSVTFTFFEAS